MSSSASARTKSLIDGLTYIQNLPTPFITTFMLIHLAAPAAATIGGVNTASRVMLLGREYYHGMPQETLLVYAPIALHVSAGLVNRLIKLARAARRMVHDIINPGTIRVRRTQIISPANAMQLTGYPLLYLLLPHIATHRVFPSTPSPPISAISPSELDFSFVHFGLKNWPARSWVMYSLLTGAGIMHVAYGLPIVWRTIRKLLKELGLMRLDSNLSFSRRSAPKAGLAALGIVLLGIFRISREDVFLTRLASMRMLAAYRLSPFYH